MLCGVGCCVIGRDLGSELEVTRRVMVLGIDSTCGVRSNDRVFEVRGRACSVLFRM